jgi:hypothetical protein
LIKSTAPKRNFKLGAHHKQNSKKTVNAHTRVFNGGYRVEITHLGGNINKL